MDSFNIQAPFFGSTQPTYPQPLQLVRVTSTLVAGPSGAVFGSTIPAPLLYTSYVAQLRTDTLLPRDREPCLATDPNIAQLAPGYYLGRLCGAYGGLPLYECNAGGLLGNIPNIQSAAPSGSATAGGPIFIFVPNSSGGGVLYIWNRLTNTWTTYTSGGGGGSLIVDKDGSLVGTRPELNFITGDGTTLTVTDNSGSNRIDVTVATYSTSTSTWTLLYSAIESVVVELTTAATAITNVAAKAITNVTDSGGLFRVTCVGHGFLTGQLVFIDAVGGTTDANGYSFITVIDADTFDLQGSTFAGVYTAATGTVSNVIYPSISTLAPRTQFRWTISGGVNLTIGQTCILNFYIGAVFIGTCLIDPTVALPACEFYLQAITTIRSFDVTGDHSGTITTGMVLLDDDVESDYVIRGSGVYGLADIDSVGEEFFLSVTATFSSASAGNIIVVDQMMIEQMDVASYPVP